MIVAQKLRKQNISAYIIYMFQVEDIIRAYGLDVDRICKEYLPRFQYTEEQIADQREWYAGLIRMMKEEGVQESGHVQVVKNTLMLMAERHQELLADPKQPFYSAAYYKALPYIVELRSKGMGKEKNEIENCVDALYGATVLKMQGRELTDQTKQALQPITHLLEMLSKLYKSEE
ncbi:MAG: DUF4924 family protein [Bacteroidaceae bacterium]|nr:DUF4924 family protein [Bacteroidaceae bacterium]MBR1902732.1 DUF4924 family protein [Bacteroidaceae bacterium]